MTPWLWEACWRDNYVTYGMMMGTGGGMMRSMPATESALMSPAVQSQFIEAKSTEEQILDLEEIIEFLEKIWLEDPYIQEEIDPDDWKRFMEAVYESLYELKVQSFD